MTKYDDLGAIQGGIAGHQIQETCQAIFFERVQALVTAMLREVPTQEHFAITLERHGKLLVHVFDEQHVFGVGKPDVIARIREWDLILDGSH